MNFTKGGTVSGATTVAAEKSSVSADRSTYDLPDHTVAEPRVAIFSRKLPSQNGQEPAIYNIKMLYGKLNADGTARKGNILIDTRIQVPFGHEAEDAQEALLRHVGVLRDTGITDDLLVGGRIPLSD